MRASVHTHSFLLILACVMLLLAALMGALGAQPAGAATSYLPPALYVYGSATLSGSATVSSPITGGQPSAALYVKGTVTNSGSGSLSSVSKITGSGVPLMSVFMPDSRINALTQASQPSRPSSGVTTYAKGLTISGASKDYGSIDVTGSLTISGSGTYTFGWVNVSGSVLIKSTSGVATISIDSLRVGGSLTVNTGTLLKLGPTYVAGSTGLTGSGQWNMGLLVTDGDVTIGGTQTMGSEANPATILMTSASKKALTYNNTGLGGFCGLLCNRNGSFVQNSGKIVGSVLCNTTATMKSSASIAYDPTAGSAVLGVLPPTTTALVNGGPLPTAPWYRTGPVSVSLAAVANDWASVTGISYTVNGVPGAFTGATGSFTVPTTPYTAPSDGVYTVQYSAKDNIGNSEAPRQFVCRIDTTPPDTSITSGLADGAWTSVNTPTYGFSGSDALTSPDQLTFEYQVDGSSAWATCTSPFQLPALSEGTHTVTFRALDLAGNADTTPASRTVKVDATPPTVSITEKPAAWIGVTSAHVAWSGSDDLAPLADLRFATRLDQSDWSAYADITSVDLPEAGEGEHVFGVRAIDPAGNVSGQTNCTFNFDATSPTTIASGWDQDEWNNIAVVTVTLTAADGGSGPDRTYVSIDSDDPAGFDLYDPAAKPSVSAEGAHTIYYYSTDKASPANTEGVKSAPLKIDRTGPTTTAGGWSQDEWQPSAVTVTLLADDGSGAGPDKTYYRIGGGETDPFMLYDPTARPVVTGAGEHVISFYSTDKAAPANREDVKTATVLIDRTPPTSPGLGGADAAWHNADVTVVASGSTDDNTAVPVHYEHRLNAGAWIAGPACTVKADHTDGSVEGENTVRFRAVDAAENASDEVSATVKIDTVAPSVTFTLDSPTEAVPTDGGSVLTSYYNEPAFTIVAETGAGSELAQNGLQLLDGTAPIHGAASGEALPRPLSDGAHTLVATAVDVAGNATTSAPVTFSVDAPAFAAQYSEPYEGDVIGLYADDSARTGNADGSWEGKTWAWRITSPDLPDAEPVSFDGPVGFVAVADGGPYDVQLTVTDAPSHARCVTTRRIAASPQAPWVTALNIQVLEGKPATLLGRFLDPGWGQTHDVTWDLRDCDGNAYSGGTVDVVAEDNLPAMDTGYVSGTTAALDADRGPYSGQLTVSDSNGQSTTSRQFTVTPVPADPNADEGLAGSDTITRPASSPVVKGGDVHLSYIQSQGDVDIFEVRTPDDQQLPYGTEVLVTLRDLPADYDVAVIHDYGEDVDPSAPLEATSFEASSVEAWMDSPIKRNSDWTGVPIKRNSDWGDLPIKRNSDWSDLPIKRNSDWAGLPIKRNSPFIANAYLDAPIKRNSDWDAIPIKRNTDWDNVPIKRNSGYLRPPLDSMLFTHMDSAKTSLDGYSFENMGFTGLGEAGASSTVVTFPSLGFDNEQMLGKRIAGYSAHLGTTCETVLVKTAFANGRTYVAVKGANGAWSDTEPYTLQVETSLPLSICDVAPEVPDLPLVGTDPTTETEQPVDEAQPLTLYVTQGQRMDAIYGDGSYASVLDSLRPVCTDDDGPGRGLVISVASTLFDSWDEAPSSVDEANKVTAGIRDEIQRYLRQYTSIKYVVLVGSDEVIPQHRVQDETTLSNEAEYLERSSLVQREPLGVSMSKQTVLTDDYYADADPIPYDGRSLYIPDVAVSRLVETPAEIKATIDAFATSVTANGGLLRAETSVLTGQDFMSDGVQRVYNVLSDAGLAPTLFNPSLFDPATSAPVPGSAAWAVGDVRTQLLQSAVSKAGGVNAHFTHYFGISADGYDKFRADPQQDFSAEFLSSQELAGAPGLEGGKLFFSMGCHAGLSVPDDQVSTDAGAGAELDPRLDIAQAIARRQGVLVASTGYGYGDLEGIAGTEALIGNFADQATTADALSAATHSGQPIGLALAEAKRQYLGSLTAVSPYDEKSSVSFTMYGMPQYRLPCTNPHPAQTGVQKSWFTPQAASFNGAFSSRPFVLNISDPTSPDQQPVTRELVEATSDQTARFITAGGDMQATPGCPIQPRVVVDLKRPDGADPAKGAIITGGTYVEIPSFDPAISRWTTEWEVSPKEVQVTADGWWPQYPVKLRTVGSTDDAEQRLVVLSGQFLSTSAVGESTVTGIERVWTHLDVELTRGSETDSVTPTVQNVTMSHQGATWTARVDAWDAASGIARIIVTYLGNGTSASTSFAPPSGSTSPFEVDFVPSGMDPRDVRTLVTVIDGAGNTTTVTGKGMERFIDNQMLLRVTTLAGAPGSAGSDDGTGATARFEKPIHVASDASGNVYVADNVNHTIRKVTPGGIVSTLAGSAGNPGSNDGVGTDARFNRPWGVACDAAGNIYVADSSNASIRKITPGGTVTTLVSAGAGLVLPTGIACDGAGNLLVADTGSQTICRVDSVGDVTTLAGSPGNQGSDDGIGGAARFMFPVAVTCDGSGNVFVADQGNNTIRKIAPDGEVTTLAGSAAGPGAVDGAGATARFNQPTGVACDAAGNVYVADYGNNTIRRVTPAGTVTTVAGSAGLWGSTDGTGTSARFNAPAGITVDAAGNVYVPDSDNNTIRKALCPSLAGGYVLVAQQSHGTVSIQGQPGPAPEGVAVLHGSSQAFSITPQPHYHIDDVIVDGLSKGAIADYVFTDVGENHTITASFAIDQVALDLSTVGHGNLMKLPDRTTYDWGSTVQLTPMADPSWTFLGWGGDAAGSTTPLTVLMNDDKTITATFVGPPALASPNGGENWVVGSVAPITWSPGTGDSVTVEMSRNGGVDWAPVLTGIDNDGAEAWTVTGPVTSQARLRVVGAYGSDESDLDFTVGLFAPHADLATGASPRRIAFADFNDDGKQDLVTADSTANAVSVRLGNGDGSFLGRSSYGTGTRPLAVSVADFNADGRQDLVTANQLGGWLGFGSISILLGVGDGTFVAHADTANGSGPTDIAVADLDGNGTQDLVTANQGSAAVGVMLGNGDGTFQAVVKYSTNGSPMSVTVGDFNSDGKQDVATDKRDPHGFGVLLGNGDGTLQAEINRLTPAAYAYSLTAADINMDGELDLITPNYQAQSVSIFLGNGDGTMGAGAVYATASGPEGVVVADVDGDGRPDVMTANSGGSGSMSLLLGNGDGTLKANIDSVAGSGAQGVAAADLNGDGKVDLGVANRSADTISILINRPDLPAAALGYAAKADYATATNPYSVAVGDFNDDGRRDAATACWGGDGVSVLLGTGAGGFAPRADYATDHSPSDVAVGDFNADGHQDLATSNANGGNVSVLLGVGDGTFGARVNYGAGGAPYSVVVGDFNRDGRQDLATCNQSASTVSVLRGNGNGTFQAKLDYSTAARPHDIKVGDFNGDGKQDLVTANYTAGNISVLLCNGASSFAAKVDYPIGTYTYSVAVGDFNGDGWQDLAATYDGSKCAVLMGNGDGTFDAKVDYTTGGSPICVTVADVDGDGRQDLVTANFTSNNVSVLLGSGDGTFQTRKDYATGSYPIGVAASDFNGDGKRDLIVANQVGNSVSVLMNTKPW